MELPREYPYAQESCVSVRICSRLHANVLHVEEKILNEFLVEIHDFHKKTLLNQISIFIHPKFKNNRFRLASVDRDGMVAVHDLAGKKMETPLYSRATHMGPALRKNS